MKPVDEGSNIAFHDPMKGVGTLCDEDGVKSEPCGEVHGVVPVCFAQVAFDAISDHGIAEPPACHKCDKATGWCIRNHQITEIHCGCGQAVAFFEQAVEMRFASENAFPR